MTPVAFSTAAAADLDGHLAYIAADNPAAAARYANLVASAVMTLGLFPLAGREIRNRYKFPVPGTNLVLVYRLRHGNVEITRCFDGRTNWTRRLRP